MRSFLSASYFLLFAIMSFTTICVSAQPQGPISAILDADGSVIADKAGSFDPAGFRMKIGPKGEPRFIAADQSVQGGCNDNWDSNFYINGTDGLIRAVVSDGLGNVYVAGSFRVVQTVIANSIAKWDGTSWSALGTGIVDAGGIWSVAVSGSDVYVAGDFSSAGGVPANNVAKWNGSAWSALGTGMGSSGSHRLHAIAVSGTDVYVGGRFESSGGFPNYIAHWNGTSWSGMGTGMNNWIYALAVSGGSVYAGGSFTTAGGTPATGIAKWDGTSWASVGTGVDNRVLALAVSGSDIYAGGAFTTAGGNPAANIAKWNGSSWSALGSGVNNTVDSIAVSGSDVYVGGDLTIAGGTSASRIAKWNGSAWSAMGIGIGPPSSSTDVNGIAVLGNTVIAGGYFRTAGGAFAQSLATWSENTWSSFEGTSVDWVVRSVAVSGTDVYVVGDFDYAGPVLANNVAKWDGTSWSALGTGIPGGFLNAVAVSGNDVYVGGNFSTAGGISARNIAKWNGTAWSQLGSGLNNGVVSAITILNSDVYAGGSFTTAGGIAANHIAKWNGTSWSGLNSAIVNTVTTIVPSGNILYVGTVTTTLDSPNYFLKYDGSTWTPLGTGMTGGGVSSIALSGSDVYVAGLFNGVGGVSVTRIAKFDGTSWSALGAGLPGNSSNIKLATLGTDLFAVGDFRESSGAPGNGVAKWNGTSWEPLGAGLGNNLDSHGLSVAPGGDSIYVGGFFTTAGCNLSPYFARWRQTLWTGASGTDWHTGANWGSGQVPSPNAGVTIEANDAAITTADVTVSSLIVTGGRTVSVGAGRTLTVTGNLDLTDGNLAGPGTLIVNGNLTMNGANITGLGSILVSNSMILSGGSILSVGPITTNGNFTINGGNINGATSIATGGNLSLSGGDVTNVPTITTTGNLSLNNGNFTGVSSVVINGNLALNGGKITGTGSISVNTCSANAVTGGSSSSYVTLSMTRCVNSSGIYRFPVGTGTVYSPVELSNIVGSSNFTAQANSGAYPGAATGLPVNRLGRWWNLTNGGITKADLNFFYPDAEVVGIERRYSAYRIDGGTATRLPTDIDETANRAFVPGVTNFSPWTLAEGDPAVLTMTGRVITNSGRGAESVLVSLTDDQGMTRYAVTNPFGNFRFFNITTFRLYTIRVTPKKFKFLTPQRVVDFDELTGDVTFVSRFH